MAERLDEDAAFDLMLRRRASEPAVRALMSTLNRVFDGDGYPEDEDGFRWLVIDASRIVDFATEERSVMEAFIDAGRWEPSLHGEASEIIAEIEDTLRSAGFAPVPYSGGSRTPGGAGE